MSKAVVAIAGLSLLLLGGSALAQKKVYRCEAGGKVSYGDAPCKGGAEVAADDPRSEADRKAARDAVQREKQLTEQASAERRAAEAQAPRQVAGHIAYSDAEKAAAAASAPKPPARRKTVVKTAASPARR
jgi:Domain of unknown function (DUF4124)